MTGTNTKTRLIIVSVIALVCLLLLGLAFHQLRTDSLETARLMNISNELGEKEEISRIVRQIRESASAEIEAFEAVTFSSNTLVSTIESIENAGRALGLTTKIASVEREGEDGAGSQAVKIIVESTGSWRGNFSLLKALENLPQKVKIESASLAKSESSWRSRIALTLSSFDQ